MEFSPANPIVKLCLEGMALEEKQDHKSAAQTFMQAWDAASNDFERFISAYYVTRHQNTVADQLNWLETTVALALKINDSTVASALPLLYQKIAKCYEDLGDLENAAKNYEKSVSTGNHPTDKGPFYHGTRADLQVGDFLTAGGISNYESELVMNHIYFTALVNGAGLAAALAKGHGRERVYIVEPSGSFENDPNVTDKKFPGNPTRSYRSSAPLKIVGEVADWARLTNDDLQQWKEKLAKSEGKIIN